MLLIVITNRVNRHWYYCEPELGTLRDGTCVFSNDYLKHLPLSYLSKTSSTELDRLSSDGTDLYNRFYIVPHIVSVGLKAVVSHNDTTLSCNGL